MARLLFKPYLRLYALCMGPPDFAMSLQPLDLAELLRSVSSIAHFLTLLGNLVEPLLKRAERMSSLVFGTFIFLVWRPHST